MNTTFTASSASRYCIVSLPPGVFINAGAASKTNLFFFKKGRSTERIWYYDLSDVKVTKRSPLFITAFEDFYSSYVVGLTNLC